jgi:hypothetical protein
MAHPIVNPFNFETPSDRWSFTDREEELPRLVTLMKRTRQRLLLYGRRRMGKTSLIRHAAVEAKTPHAFVDLSIANDLTEVAKKLVASVPVEERLADKLLRLLRASVGKIVIKGGQLALEADLRAAPKESLEHALAFLDDYAAATDQCLTLCLDEFQDLRRLEGDRAEWHLRGIIQHHSRLNFIFSGSDHRLLASMTEPNAAFYKQLELMAVGPIDPKRLGDWVDLRMRRGGLPGRSLGAAIVAKAGPCTGDVIRLAKGVFELAATDRPGDIVSEAFDAIALGYLAPEFEMIWRPLAPNQRMLLRAIADGRRPFERTTLVDYSLSVGGVGTAQTALFDRQILTRVAGEVGFDSPFFQRWVEKTGETGP